jgi:protein gp37
VASDNHSILAVKGRLIAEGKEAMGIKKNTRLIRKIARCTVWNGVAHEDREALWISPRWRTLRKIFIHSMVGLSHERRRDALVLDVWQIMWKTTHYNYQIFTKRPGFVKKLVDGEVRNVLPDVRVVTEAS